MRHPLSGLYNCSKVLGIIMEYLLLFISIISFGAVLLLVFSFLHRPQYVKAQILTPAEVRFYHFLLHALPATYAIFSQVRLATVVNLKNVFFLWKQFNPLGAKCVDFVVCEKTSGNIVAVIELDDSSHNRWDRKKRDVFVNEVLHSAGVPILHVKVKQFYDVNEFMLEFKKTITITKP
jgi:hypothetical protein